MTNTKLTYTDTGYEFNTQLLGTGVVVQYHDDECIWVRFPKYNIKTVMSKHSLLMGITRGLGYTTKNLVEA